MASGIRTEYVVEHAALAWLESLGNVVLHGSGIAAGELWVNAVESLAEATA